MNLKGPSDYSFLAGENQVVTRVEEDEQKITAYIKTKKTRLQMPTLWSRNGPTGKHLQTSHSGYPHPQQGSLFGSHGFKVRLPKPGVSGQSFHRKAPERKAPLWPDSLFGSVYPGVFDLS